VIPPRRRRIYARLGVLHGVVEPSGGCPAHPAHRRERIRVGANYWDNLILWRTLIRLRTDIPIPTTTKTHQPSILPPAPDIIGQLSLWK
jgi:hypothetical protein